jgi:hypothetical protein
VYDREAEFDELLKKWAVQSVPKTAPDSLASTCTKTALCIGKESFEQAGDGQGGANGAALPPPDSSLERNPEPETSHAGKARTPEPHQQQLFTAPISNNGTAEKNKLVLRSTATLRPHPDVQRLEIAPSEERLRDLEKLGTEVFDRPLLVTTDGLIIDGYDLSLLAQRTGRTTLLCIEIAISASAALARFVSCRRGPEWLSDFCSTELALGNEPWYREQARARRARQSNGGPNNADSSNLTEGQHADTRDFMSDQIVVSAGSISKVKQTLKAKPAPELLAAARMDEISIHRAWLLSRMPVSTQKEALAWPRLRRRQLKRIRSMLARKAVQTDSRAAFLRDLYTVLTTHKADFGIGPCQQPFDDLLETVMKVLSEPVEETNAA